MDWQLVIDRNRAALLTIIVALIAKLGLSDGGVLTTLPHFLYHRALRILRAAESTLRRLIVIAAHELTLRGLKLPKPRVTFTNFMLLKALPADHIPAFNLIDSRKIFGLETSDSDEFGHSNCDEEGNSHGDDGQQFGHGSQAFDEIGAVRREDIANLQFQISNFKLQIEKGHPRRRLFSPSTLQFAITNCHFAIASYFN